MTRQPLFVALPAPDKFWREYRIYADRVELETILGVMTIPFDDIDRVESAASPQRGATLTTRALVIDRNQGWIRRVCIRPREPDGFHRALKSAMKHHRGTSLDS